LTQLILKVNPEYEKLVPPLTTAEYNALKESIKTEGQQLPIIINQDFEILDGHHRNKACLELDIEPDFEVKHFEDKLSERLFVVEANLRRRQLNALDAVALSLEAERIIGLRAKQKKEATYPQEGGFGLFTTPCGSNEQNGIVNEPIHAREIAAEKAGVSETTFHRAKTILEKGSPELQEKVREGKTSIAHAYNVITTQENHKNPKPIPQGTFNVILADPPWQYNLQKRGSTLGHYQDLSVNEICDLKPSSSEDAILFLWATNPKLPEALQVMQAWGFTYKTNLVWVKDKIGTGYYFRGQHELLLVGVKGSIGVPEEHNRPSSVLNSARQEHSKKPTEVYELIEKMYPNRQYLEFYARNQREGWTSWGNEV
jgi:N6-adenosine-specific RNA methylase IME4